MNKWRIKRKSKGYYKGIDANNFGYPLEYTSDPNNAKLFSELEKEEVILFSDEVWEEVALDKPGKAA